MRWVLDLQELTMVRLMRKEGLELRAKTKKKVCRKLLSIYSNNDN